MEENRTADKQRNGGGGGLNIDLLSGEIIYDPPLDPGISDVVMLLRSNGIKTFASCEGGEGHSFQKPTVRIRANDPSNMLPDIDKIADILSKAGYCGYYLKQYQAYQLNPTPWRTDEHSFIELEFWWEAIA